MIKKYLQDAITDRTKRTNLNIIISIFFKVGSILLSFLLIPLTINYIKPDAYGVWLTLTSLVGWVAMFDLGIANGLRNKLSQSLAVQNFQKGKSFVSTTYIIIGIVALSLMTLYFIFYRFINWQSVFNTDFIPENELQNVVTIVFVLFLLKFISDIINVIAAAYQMVFLSSVLLFFSNLGTTLAVWIISKTTSANMVLLALSLSVIPFLISVIASVYLFRNKFNKVTPTFKSIDFKEAGGIVKLGSQFFILQIIVLIVYQMDNILIAQFFRPSEVTNFNIAYKYFSIVSIIFTVILTPYWTAFTEAYFNEDFNWLKKTMNRLMAYWFLTVFVLAIMFLIAGWAIKLWVGDSVVVPLSLSISICVYIAVINWNSILASFLNGIGKIKVQIICAIIMGIVNIPLCFFFVKVLGFGTYAMPLSNSISLLLGAIICYIQCIKIINKKATGVWNK